MAAQFFDALEQNAKRLSELKALDVPVKLIWGQYDPYITVAGRASPVSAQARLPHCRAGSPLAASRSTRASGQGHAVMTENPTSASSITVP
jgi:pimeloyl-ACP methyl ester carboxylesterase